MGAKCGRSAERLTLYRSGCNSENVRSRVNREIFYKAQGENCALLGGQYCEKRIEIDC